MAEDNLIKDIFREGGLISEFLDNYIPREPQIEGSLGIFNMLNDKNINQILFEGETGVGKSFAYLFPAFIEELKSMDNGERKAIIIATSGISLQEQLINKDLPFVKKVMTAYNKNAEHIKFSLMKGRQNFICNKKYEQIFKNMPDVNKEFKDEVDKLFSEDGDLSKLSVVMSPEMNQNLCCTDEEDCSSSGCEYYGECHYYAHRRKAVRSDIIVVNYHVLFTALNTSAVMLPNFNILICDEAHEIPSTYREFASININAGFFKKTKSKFSNLISIIESSPEDIFNSELASKIILKIKNDLDIIEYNVDQLFIEIENKYSNLYSPQILEADTDKEILSKVQYLKNSLADLEYNCEEFQDHVISLIDDEEDDFEDSILGKFSDRENKEIKLRFNSLNASVTNQGAQIKEIISGISDDNSVVFVENKNNRVTLSAKLIETGDELFNLFGIPGLKTVFTSATMSVGGSFNYIKENLGISELNTIDIIGQSPFNLTEQQLWYLPPDSLAGNQAGFDDVAIKDIVEIIKACRGGVLCLFTSVKSMNNAYNRIKPVLRGMNIYKQGEIPKMQLIDKMRQGDGVLLATRSFFTGVDIQGKALRCVIVDKFPFPSPADPIQIKRGLLHKDAFFRFSIPEMIILLKQAVGRGVRSVDDKCVICILDGRMSTARYKTRIFNSFNYKKTGTRNINDVKKFIDDYLDE